MCASVHSTISVMQAAHVIMQTNSINLPGAESQFDMCAYTRCMQAYRSRRRRVYTVLREYFTGIS